MLNLSDRNREAITSPTPWAVDFVKITVTSSPLGTCNVSGVITEGVTEVACGSSSWTAYDPPETGEIFITNHFHDITVDGNRYVAAGEFLNFSDISDNLEVKDNTLDISLSGVNYNFTAVVLGNAIEGSLVEVSRGFFDETTGRLYGATLTGGVTSTTETATDFFQAIYPRWTGSINNYSIVDDYNFTHEDKITISVSCKSLLTTLIAKVAGRYTSPQGYQTFTADDRSMEFVPSLPTFNPSFGNEE